MASLLASWWFTFTPYRKSTLVQLAAMRIKPREEPSSLPAKQHLSRVKRIRESEVEAKNQKKNIVITWGCASAPVSPCKFLAPRNKHHSQRCTSHAHIRVLFVCAFCTKHLCLSVQLVGLQHCNVTNCAPVIKWALLLPSPLLQSLVPPRQQTCPESFLYIIHWKYIKICERGRF